MAAVLKTAVGAISPWVRIPRPPLPDLRSAYPASMQCRSSHPVSRSGAGSPELCLEQPLYEQPAAEKRQQRSDHGKGYQYGGHAQRGGVFALGGAPVRGPSRGRLVGHISVWRIE